jgi:23S rRNA pseudouridine2605 synthase
MRLNKYIAQATGISRREADELISSRKVFVNGNEPELGLQVGDGDEVKVNSEVVSLPNEFTYLLVNKPVGHVTSRNSQDGSPTLYDLIPEKYSRLKYVGRLDKESSGLILMTNDGDYSHTLTHPSFRKEKVYVAVLDRPLAENDFDAISRGVELDDGISQMEIQHTGDSKYVIKMKEGRNRQIRRTFSTLGYTVIKLKRTQFGGYSLDELGDKEFIEVMKR